MDPKEPSNESADVAKSSKKAPLGKQRALALIASLDPEDDERTTISKKISWILRKGAVKLGIPINDGWVKLRDILNAEILDDVADRSEDKLMSIIRDSNTQKLRYEVKEASEVKLTFKPGNLGLIVANTGRIKRIMKDGQASTMDVQVGMVVDEIDGQTFSHQLMDEKVAGTEDYEMIFDKDGVSVRALSKAERKKEERTVVEKTALEVVEKTELRGDAPAFIPTSKGGVSSQMSTTAQPFTPMLPYYHGYQWPYGQWPYVQQSTRYSGYIKSWKMQKGYGFIESPSASRILGLSNNAKRDIFVHESEIGDFDIGDMVTFEVAKNPNNDSDLPQAVNLLPGDGKGKNYTSGKSRFRDKKENKGEGKGGKTDKDEMAAQS